MHISIVRVGSCCAPPGSPSNGPNISDTNNLDGNMSTVGDLFPPPFWLVSIKTDLRPMRGMREVPSKDRDKLSAVDVIYYYRRRTE